MNGASSGLRYPGVVQSIRGFTVTSGSLAQILISSNNPTQMVVVEGIDVYAKSSGSGPEQFYIGLYQSTGTVFVGYVFGNQVSANTSLNFSWRGALALYNGEQLRLTTLTGDFSASCFGFNCAADNAGR